MTQHHQNMDYIKYLITLNFGSEKKKDFYDIKRTVDEIISSIINLQDYNLTQPPLKVTKKEFGPKNYQISNHTTYLEKVNLYSKSTKTRIKVGIKADDKIYKEAKISISRLKKHEDLEQLLSNQTKTIEDILKNKQDELQGKEKYHTFDYTSVLADPTYKK